MRTTWMLASFVALGAGCSWSSFDDLADQTWVHSTQKPNVGSSDYATAVVGVTVGTSGGRLAVVGNSAPTYSTLAFDAKGGSALGPNPQKLGQHFIVSLDEQPILVTDGMGRVALVAAAIDSGNIAVVVGDADSVADGPFPSPQPPDAATFFGASGELVIAAGSTLFVEADTSGVKACTPVDSSNAPVTIAALDHDATHVWAWTKDGRLFGYDGAMLGTVCQTPSGSAAPTIAPSAGGLATSFMPGTGARILIVQKWAVLAAHANSATTGSVFVADLTASPITQVGTTLNADGIVSATQLSTGGSEYIALGFPTRAVGGTTTGQVDLLQLHTDTGALDAAPVEQLNDDQPDSNEVFGRALATMTFNGKDILVVAASNEVFSYYRTQLYSDTR